MQINKKIIICTLLILTIFSIIGGVSASDSLNETSTIKETHSTDNSISTSQSPLSDTNLKLHEDSVSDNNKEKNKNTNLKEDIKSNDDKLKINFDNKKSDNNTDTDKLKINQNNQNKLEDSSPTTIYVAHNGTNDKDGKTKENATSLANALTIAQNGTTLHLITGTYKPGPLDSIYDKKINITGEDDVILDGDERNSIFYFGNTSEVTLKNLIIINGYTPESTYNSGALVGNAGKLTIINCTFANSISEKNGGAIYNPGQLTIINSTFENNYADGYGGAIFTQNGGTGTIPSLIIDNCVFTNNSAKGGSLYGGGAIYIQSASFANITNSLFQNNKIKESGGGAIEFAQTPLGYINNCSFINNSANGQNYKDESDYGGGAISFVGVYSDLSEVLTVTNSLFINNTAKNYGGGAIYARYSKVNIQNSVLINNRDETRGYALYRRTGNPSTAQINANNNWWGSNDKPLGKTNSLTINRWLILTIHNETEIKTGETAKIVVSLNNYTTGTSNGTLTKPITVERPVELYTNLGTINGKLVNGEFKIDYKVPDKLKIISTKVDSEEQVLFVITTGTDLELNNITGHMGSRVEYIVKVNNNYTTINKGHVEIYFDDELISTIQVSNGEAKGTLMINKNIGTYTITAKYIDPTEEFENNQKTAKLYVNGIDNIVNSETFNKFFDTNNILKSDVPFDELIFEGTINNKALTINKKIILTGNNALFNNSTIIITADDVKVDNIMFNINKSIDDTNAVIYSEANNTIIENNKINYMAPNTDDSYVIYLDSSNKAKILNNTIIYTGYNGYEIKTMALYAIDSDEVIIKDNNFNIHVPSIGLVPSGDYSYQLANSAGLVINSCEKLSLDNNSISIKYSDFDDFYFDTINGVHILFSDKSKITNNYIELKGHRYSYPIWIDESKDIEISNNDILGESELIQANSISLNGKSSGIIENNNITAIAPVVVYPIYLNDNENYIATATVRNNNIKGYSNTVYGIYTEEAKTTISKNNIYVNGNYTLGIVSHKTNVIITDNIINSNASNTGEALMPQSSVPVETVAICTSNSEIEIKNNKLTSTGKYTINAIKSNGIIENNQLKANNTIGDLTIKTEESNIEIKTNTNKVLPETIGNFFVDGVLKESSFDELIFTGTFNNLKLTINKTITLTGKEAIFNNTALNIISDNVKVNNITFIADKIFDNTHAIIYSEANNTIIKNNTLNYNAPNTDDSYVILIEESDKSEITDNKITYNGKLGTDINTIVIYARHTQNLRIKNNDINAIIPSKELDSVYDYKFDEDDDPIIIMYFNAHSAGIIIDNSTNLKLENNNIHIQYNGIQGKYDSIYTIGIHESDNSIINQNNIELKGHKQAYGLSIDSTKNHKTYISDNNITIYSDDYQSTGIEGNGITAITITGNKITTIAKNVAYPITISDLNHKAESIINNNEIKGTANIVYGIYAQENELKIDNNQINIDGNYPIGIVSHTANSKIFNNIINSIGTNNGSYEGKQSGVPLETTGICASYAIFEIINNTIKTTGEHCIDAIELRNGTIIKNNTLIAANLKGDASIKNNGSIMDIDNDKISLNDVTMDKISEFFDENYVLKSDSMFKELIFHGEFKDLTLTINREITLISDYAVFKNASFNIMANNVKISNFTFIADKIIPDINALIYTVANNTVLENNKITYNAPNTDDSYAIYANHVHGLEIINNSLNYNGKLGDNINTIVIYVNDSTNINIKYNNITATLAPMSENKGEILTKNNMILGISSSIKNKNSAGILIENSAKLKLENNSILINYNNESSDDNDIITAVKITKSADTEINKNNIEIEGQNQVYGLSIDGENINLKDNTIGSKSNSKANGIAITTNTDGLIENNTINVNSDELAQGITIKGLNNDTELIIKDNKITVESDIAYALIINNTNAEIINNNLNSKGKEGLGLKITNANANIENNTITADGLNDKTSGISTINANVTIKNNNITSTRTKTIELTNTTGIITNNNLTANNTTGDKTIIQNNSNLIIDNDKKQETPIDNNTNKTETPNKTEDSKVTPNTPKQENTQKTSQNKGKTKQTAKPKQIIVAKNLKIKKSTKALKIKVKLKKLKGKILKNKKIKLRFRGKTYKSKTNKKGKAVFKIPKKVIKKLKKGKTYKYTVRYKKYKLTKKITVKK